MGLVFYKKLNFFLLMFCLFFLNKNIFSATEADLTKAGFNKVGTEGFAQISVGLDGKGSSSVWARRADNSLYRLNIETGAFVSVNKSGLTIYVDYANNAYTISIDNKIYKFAKGSLDWIEITFISGITPLKLAVNNRYCFVLASDNKIYIKDMSSTSSTWQSKLDLTGDLAGSSNIYVLGNSSQLYIKGANNKGYIYNFDGTNLTKLADATDASIPNKTYNGNLPEAYKKVIYFNTSTPGGVEPHGLFDTMALSESTGQIFSIRFRVYNNGIARRLNSIDQIKDFGANDLDDWWILWGDAGSGNYNVYRKIGPDLPKDYVNTLKGYATNNQLVVIKSNKNGKYLKYDSATKKVAATGEFASDVDCQFKGSFNGNIISFLKDTVNVFGGYTYYLRGTNLNDVYFQPISPSYAVLYVKTDATTDYQYNRDANSKFIIELVPTAPVMDTALLSQLTTKVDTLQNTLNNLISKYDQNNPKIDVLNNKIITLNTKYDEILKTKTSLDSLETKVTGLENKIKK